MKVVRTDRELTCPGIDEGLLCRGAQLEGFSFTLNSIPPLRDPEADDQEPLLPNTAVS